MKDLRFLLYDCQYQYDDYVVDKAHTVMVFGIHLQSKTLFKAFVNSSHMKLLTI